MSVFYISHMLRQLYSVPLNQLTCVKKKIQANNTLIVTVLTDVGLSFSHVISRKAAYNKTVRHLSSSTTFPPHSVIDDRVYSLTHVLNHTQWAGWTSARCGLLFLSYHLYPYFFLIPFQFHSLSFVHFIEHL